MERKLSRIECDPKCGFIVQSEDEKEALDIGIKHAKIKHAMDVSIADARKMLTTVSA